MKKSLQKGASRRLSIIGGQVKGIQEMVAEEAYCVDIITQIEAARQALSGVKDLILKNHLETHVIHQMKHGKEKQASDEILKIYKLSSK